MANEVVDTAMRVMDPSVELNFTERAAIVGGGIVLATIGAQPRPNKVLSLIAVVAGSALAIRGAMPQAGHRGSHTA